MLFLIIFILVLFALFGGLVVNPWLFLLLVVALVLLVRGDGRV